MTQYQTRVMDRLSTFAADDIINMEGNQFTYIDYYETGELDSVETVKGVTTVTVDFKNGTIASEFEYLGMGIAIPTNKRILSEFNLLMAQM